MTLIVCLDKRNGMRFNNRPQSSDRCVTERISRLSETCDDVYFYETGDLAACMSATEKLIIFRWDKVYPSDTKFPMEDVLNSFTLECVENFPGYSHDVICQEVYVR